MMTTTKDKNKQTNHNNERWNNNMKIENKKSALSCCSVTIKAVITAEGRYSCCGVSSFSPTGL